MRRENIFFIDKNGNKMAREDIYFHEELAEEIMQENPELLEEFKKSGEKSKTTFLILKGYICVAEEEKNSYISAIYSSLSLTEQTRNILGEYKEDGQEIYDIIKNTLEPAQIAQIKTWLIQEGKTEEVMNRIYQEMFGWNKVNDISKDEAR